MPTLPKDEKKVQLAQHAYDEGIDHFLQIIKNINVDIVEICDLIHGYTMRLGKQADPQDQDDPLHKYNLSAAQYAALKEQRNFWLSYIKAPDKLLDHINNELREKHKSKKSGVTKASDNKQQVASNVAEPKFQMNAVE